MVNRNASILASEKSDEPKVRKGLDSPQLTEERSKWVNEVLSEMPQYLALRERALHLSGGFSFANVTHSMTVSSAASVSRETVLELISQHLRAIGFNLTADIMEKETGLTFQNKKQNWTRTDLLLLASMAVSHREDPWTIKGDPFHQYLYDYMEEDLFSSPYREDPSTVFDEYFNPNCNVVFKEAKATSISNIKLASLKRLAVAFCSPKCEPGEVIPDHMFSLLFLSIHTITSAEHFFRILATLFDFEVIGTDYELPEPEVLKSLRKNIIKMVGNWVIIHGSFIGRTALNSIFDFFERVMKDPKYNTNADIKEDVPSILKNISMIKSGKKIEDTNGFEGEPNIPDYKVLFNPKLSILDPDATEVAKQITLLTHQNYKLIHSMEFFMALKSRKESLQTPTLNNYFAFLEKLSCLFAETFLKAEDKLKAYKRIYEIIKELNNLKNYQVVACLTQLMLRSDLVSFQLQDKEKMQLKEVIKELSEFYSNVSLRPSYEKKIQDDFNKQKEHCIPNMYVEMLLIDDSILQMDDNIDGLINWEKISCISERCSILYHFRSDKFYHYHPIPQIQNVIQTGATMTTAEIENSLSNYFKLF